MVASSCFDSVTLALGGALNYFLFAALECWTSVFLFDGEMLNLNYIVFYLSVVKPALLVVGKKSINISLNYVIGIGVGVEDFRSCMSAYCKIVVCFPKKSLQYIKGNTSSHHLNLSVCIYYFNIITIAQIMTIMSEHAYLKDSSYHNGINRTP
jgi:hypothetical protein